jgi:ketosteroid isomerase-like protein
MKRILIIAILATAISSLTYAQTNDKRTAPKNNAEQEVMKAMDELIEALGRTDIAALDRLHADDFIITQSTGLTSRAQLMDAWKSGRVKNTSASDVERSIRVYGDAAVATGIYTLKGKNPSGDFTILARYTCVWVKQGGRWRIVASQLTNITQRQPQ